MAVGVFSLLSLFGNRIALASVSVYFVYPAASVESRNASAAETMVVLGPTIEPSSSRRWTLALPAGPYPEEIQPNPGGNDESTDSGNYGE